MIWNKFSRWIKAETTTTVATISSRMERMKGKMKWSWRNFSFILLDYISKKKYCFVFSQVLFLQFHLLPIYSHNICLWVVKLKRRSLEVKKEENWKSFFLIYSINKMEKEQNKKGDWMKKRENEMEQGKKCRIKTLFQKFTLYTEQMHTIQLSIDFIYKHWFSLSFYRISHNCFAEIALISVKSWSHKCVMFFFEFLIATLPSSRSSNFLTQYRPKDTQQPNFINYIVWCVREYILENLYTKMRYTNFRLKFTISEFIKCIIFFSSSKHMHNLLSWKSKLLQFT